MKFSADTMARKWSSRWHASGKLSLPVIAAAVSIIFVMTAQAIASVPLPRPRPAAAPRLEEPGPEAPKVNTAPDRAGGEPSETAPGEPAAAEAKPPELSACRRGLTDSIAIAPSIPPIKGPGGCGGEDLVRLEAIVLSSTERVAVNPAAILRCPMARAVADWVRSDMAPLAVHLGTALSELDNFDSFECRGRNRIKGAKLSEHGLANALDVRGLKFRNGNTLSLTDRAAPREIREKVLATVCARFKTVLGPGSDWYHEDHIHLDLAERRNDYKLCQWGVYDPLPAVAPLLPAERPEEAPPRLTAEEKAGSGTAAEAPPEDDGVRPPEAAPQVSRSKRAQKQKAPD